MVWVTKLVNKIQEFPYILWKTRNTILHNTDNFATKNHQKELDEVIDRIHLVKPHSRLMSHCDNQYFNKYTKEQLKNMTTYRKTNWIALANLSSILKLNL
jgi:hypothetical protein